MRLFTILFTLIPLTGCLAQSKTAPKQLGMNLASITFYSSEMVFVDAFKQSRPWASQMPGKPFDTGGPLAVDENGWVKKLNGNGHYAETLMFVDLQGHYPAGKYLCLYEGEGDIQFGEGAEAIDRRPGRIVVKATPKNGAIALRLMKTNPDDPVRNIRMIMPGYDKSYREEEFHPQFLKRWQGFSAIRFMDWGMTNNSKITKWSDRAKADHATQGTQKGVALEYQVKFAKAMNADPWFCVPHLAEDDYVREFGKFLKANVPAERKIYVEYSNECWHGGFEAGRYCTAKGRELKLAANDYEAGLRFYAQRSVEIFKLLEAELGKDRLIRVVATQPDSEWAVKTVLDWQETGKHVDALAIAPYFGQRLGKPAEAEMSAARTVDDILDLCAKEVEANGERNASLAKLVHARGLKLLAYESGQHLVGIEGAENNEKLMKLFQAANRHPRMKDLYLQDMRNWQKAGGDLFCIFASVGGYSKWGSWGVLEYADQDESAAPKLQAIRAFLE